jgi:hypothetical protein
MMPRVFVIIFFLYLEMASARLNAKDKAAEVSGKVQPASGGTKYWDADEDRVLYKYLSASYGYHGSARNNALFWRKKSNS